MKSKNYRFLWGVRINWLQLCFLGVSKSFPYLYPLLWVDSRKNNIAFKGKKVRTLTVDVCLHGIDWKYEEEKTGSLT